MTKVSVIIPVYNVEKYLRQCLDSVVNQTLKDIEIICVNDCSPDNSLDILKEYAQKDSRIRIIDLKENGGPGNARNIGIDSADGEYIMFLDPDDWYELDACELAYNQIKQNENNVLIFNYNKYFEKCNKYVNQAENRLEYFLDKINNPHIKISELNVNWIKNAFTFVQIYNRNFLNQNEIRYSNLRLCEDQLFFVKSMILTNSVSVILKPLYNYRKRSDDNSLSSSFNLWSDVINGRMCSFNYVETQNTNIYPFLRFYIDGLQYWYNKFNKYLSYKEKKSFYNQIRNIFIELNTKYDVKKIEDSNIDYDQYKKILRQNWYICCFEKFLKKIFFVEINKTHKVITILGLRIKLKRK